jgi:hypothetical protein
MGTAKSNRDPKPARISALELLASCPEGCIEAIMLAHGITTAMLVALVRAGLATARRPSAWLSTARP